MQNYKCPLQILQMFDYCIIRFKIFCLQNERDVRSKFHSRNLWMVNGELRIPIAPLYIEKIIDYLIMLKSVKFSFVCVEVSWKYMPVLIYFTFPWNVEFYRCFLLYNIFLNNTPPIWSTFRGSAASGAEKNFTFLEFLKEKTSIFCPSKKCWIIPFFEGCNFVSTVRVVIKQQITICAFKITMQYNVMCNKPCWDKKFPALVDF